MAEQEFFWTAEPDGREAEGWPAGGRPLSEVVLHRNVLWYIKLRWFAFIALMLLYLVGAGASALCRTVGVGRIGEWPLAVAAAVLVSNLVVMLVTRRRLLEPSPNLWLQIIFDLLALTVVVHFVGATGTPAPFFYAIHVGLACIFFSIRSSLRVTLLALALYCSCLALEYAGFLTPRTVFTGYQGVPLLVRGPAVVSQAAAMAAFLILEWSLMARLTRSIRMRQDQLVRAHAAVRSAQREKDEYVAHVTHQLKSPLDAIRSNIALLQGGYCGPLPDGVAAMLPKIEERARAMGQLTMDILRLEHVRTGDRVRPELVEVDLAELVKVAIEQVGPTAENKNVKIAAAIWSAPVMGDAKQIALLLDNLLANAVTYSHAGGNVSVTCRPADKPLTATLVIRDQGIGIDPDQLPHIFDEKFRTKEAVKHNPSSTGIGLAIVRSIAGNLGLAIRVKSEPGSGTAFSVRFRAPDGSEGPDRSADWGESLFDGGPAI